MPRPSITMVINRASRSSRVPVNTEAAPAAARVEHPQDPATCDPTNSPPPPSDSSIEKRIRKPSQRMLEALQDDTEGTGDNKVALTAATVPVKGKRPASEKGLYLCSPLLQI